MFRVRRSSPPQMTQAKQSSLAKFSFLALGRRFT